MNDLDYGAPAWLWGLIAIPLLVLLFLRAESQSAQRLAKLFPAARLRTQLTGTVSVARRRWRYGFLLLALAGLLATMAEPRWGYEIHETHRRGLDVIVVADVSKSMLATDLAPSRLIREKLALHDLVSELNGDRLGLVAFAGSAFLQAPLTIDYDAVLRAADEMDTDLIPLGGTNIGAGINLALDAFGKEAGGNRAILLLSDGEPTAESDQADGVKAAARAAEDGVRVFTIGLGTPEGSLIPLAGANAGELVRDADGQLVRTRLNENGLREIARAGGGFYVRLENGGSSLRKVVQDGLSRLKTGEIDARTARRPIERYQWPLAFALGSLAAGMLLAERRKTPAPAASSVQGARRSAVATVATVRALGAIGVVLAFRGSVARAADAPDQGGSGALDLYRAGRYEQAYSAFEDLAREHPGMGNLQFDAGASAYMARHYDEAVDAFGKALTTDDPALQAKSHYNFGNALFRRGEEQKNTQQKISDWRNAIQHYDTALDAIKTQPPQPGSTLAGDAAYNREIVQRRLDEALKQQPRQDKQDQQVQQSGSQQQQQPGGGKQEQKDHQQSLSQGPSQQQDQAGKRNEQQDKPPRDGASAQSQTAQRPDPSSVPNQDKARQRGDFQAQPAGTPGNELEPSKQEPAEESGKMTPDQARALLQSLKDEDTSVNLNDDPDNRNRRDEPVIKDW